MEILLLGIYAGFVWLIFIKLKLLPWTTPWKVAVAIFPVVMIALLLLLLNIFAPTTSDVRVVKYIVPVVRGPARRLACGTSRPCGRTFRSRCGPRSGASSGASPCCWPTFSSSS